MRGFMNRSRMERLQPGVEIASYEDALYPPRPYRYHTQLVFNAPDNQLVRPGPMDVNVNPVVLPSIDADALCEPPRPHAHGAAGASGPAQAAGRQPQPALKHFFHCYAPSSVGADDVLSTLGHVDSVFSEPLNCFHYGNYLSPAASTGGLSTLASSMGIPAELWACFAARESGTGPVVAPQKLRIRAAQRPRPPRPLRRGAKVIVLEGTSQVTGAVRSRAAAGASAKSGKTTSSNGHAPKDSLLDALIAAGDDETLIDIAMSAGNVKGNPNAVNEETLQQHTAEAGFQDDNDAEDAESSVSWGHEQDDEDENADEDGGASDDDGMF